jgi:hypothetical protein
MQGGPVLQTAACRRPTVGAARVCCAEMDNSIEKLDLSACSVFELYVRGLRVLVDYDEAQAIRHYRMLHLEAGEAAVREELSREITRRRAAIQDFVDTEPSTWALGDLGNSR